MPRPPPLSLFVLPQPPRYDYLDIPDENLNASQLKEKRKQKMMKGAEEAREKKRLEKEEEKAR